MGFKVIHKGSFNNFERFINRALKRDYLNILDRYGKMGVDALRANTPVESGKTAESWNYEIRKGDGKITLAWTNSNEKDGVNVAVLLIYGHGLQNGGYVEGNNFVDPVMRPIFDMIAQESWKEVTE